MYVCSLMFFNQKEKVPQKISFIFLVFSVKYKFLLFSFISEIDAQYALFSPEIKNYVTINRYKNISTYTSICSHTLLQLTYVHTMRGRS